MLKEWSLYPVKLWFRHVRTVKICLPHILCFWKQFRIHLLCAMPMRDLDWDPTKSYLASDSRRGANKAMPLEQPQAFLLSGSPCRGLYDCTGVIPAGVQEDSSGESGQAWSRPGLETAHSKSKLWLLVRAPQTNILEFSRGTCSVTEVITLRKPKAMASSQIFTVLPGQMQFIRGNFHHKQCCLTADILLLSGFQGNRFKKVTRPKVSVSLQWKWGFVNPVPTFYKKKKKSKKEWNQPRKKKNVSYIVGLGSSLFKINQWTNSMPQKLL